MIIEGRGVYEARTLVCQVTPRIQNMITSYSNVDFSTYVYSTPDPNYPPSQGDAGGMGWAAVWGLNTAIQYGQSPWRSHVGDSITSIYTDQNIRRPLSYPALWVISPCIGYTLMALTFVLQEEYIQGAVEFVGTVSGLTRLLIPPVLIPHRKGPKISTLGTFRPLKWYTTGEYVAQNQWHRGDNDFWVGIRRGRECPPPPSHHDCRWRVHPHRTLRHIPEPRDHGGGSARRFRSRRSNVSHSGRLCWGHGGYIPWPAEGQCGSWAQKAGQAGIYRRQGWLQELS